LGFPQSQHLKNLKKYHDQWDKSYTEIVIPDSVGAPEGSLFLGIQPSNQVMEAFKASEAGLKGRPLSVLSVQEDFEFIPFDYEIDGQKYTHRAYRYFENDQIIDQSASLGINHSLIISSADYRAVEIPKILQGTRYIQDQVSLGHDVYIHCKSGKGRSATMLAAWLMQYRNLTLDEAVSVIKGQRNQVSIGKFFFGSHYRQLQAFEASLKTSS